MILALALSPAHAHVPHDVVTAIAPAPALDPLRPWWLVADHDDVSDLYRSDDAGRTWVGSAGECLEDALTAAVTLDDGGVVLIGDMRAWWSADGEGAAWDPVPLPFEPTAVAGGDRLYIGGADGVWTMNHDGVAEQLLPSAVVSLHAGAGGVVALLDGEVAYTRGGDWSVVAAPPGARSATLDEANVYVGTDEGDVLRLVAEAWIACGESPLREANRAHPNIVRLATDGASLVLAHADVGPAVSVDACATWTADAAPIDLVWRDDLEDDDYYDFTELDEAFTALAVGGDHIVVGTYDGAAALVGGAWFKQPLKGADYPRGVAFSRDFAEDGLALVAAYGCGIERAFEGGARWDCPGVGLDKPGAQAISVPVDAVGLVPAYALVNRVPKRSDDAGATWVDLAGDFGPAHDLEAGPNGRVWLFPVQRADGAPGDTLRSDDGGASWHAVDGLAVIGDHVVRGMADDGGRVAAITGDKDDTTPEAVYVSEDGEDFTAVHEMDAIDDVAIAGSLLVAVGPGGIDVGVAGEWTHAADTGARRVVIASDGTIVVATRAQRLLRSDDQGATWVDLGAELPGQIEAVATHPDFAAHPEIVAMTPAGAFRVDADGTVTRWMGVQQADDQSHYSAFVAYDPPSEDLYREGAFLGTVHALPMGTVATVWLRGTRVELLGAIDGVADLELLVDGVAMGSTAAAAMPIGGVLATVEGLADGPHLVELRVRSGDGVYLDAARGTEASTPLGWSAGDAVGGPAPGPRCGCANGPMSPGTAPGLAFLAVLWGVAARVRTSRYVGRRSVRGGVGGNTPTGRASRRLDPSGCPCAAPTPASGTGAASPPPGDRPPRRRRPAGLTSGRRLPPHAARSRNPATAAFAFFAARAPQSAVIVSAQLSAMVGAPAGLSRPPHSVPLGRRRKIEQTPLSGLPEGVARGELEQVDGPAGRNRTPDDDSARSPAYHRLTSSQGTSKPGMIQTWVFSKSVAHSTTARSSNPSPLKSPSHGVKPQIESPS